MFQISHSIPREAQMGEILTTMGIWGVQLKEPGMIDRDLTLTPLRLNRKTKQGSHENPPDLK